jgi:hypothetical protein
MAEPEAQPFQLRLTEVRDSQARIPLMLQGIPMHGHNSKEDVCNGNEKRND